MIKMKHSAISEKAILLCRKKTTNRRRPRTSRQVAALKECSQKRYREETITSAVKHTPAASATTFGVHLMWDILRASHRHVAWHPRTAVRLCKKSKQKAIDDGQEA